MDRDIIFLSVSFTRDGERHEFREGVSLRSLTMDYDVSQGVFRIPNRHNLRIRLDDVRRQFEIGAAKKIFDRFGTLFGVTYGQRMVITATDRFPDIGNALEELISPQTPGETFIEAMADANRAKELSARL